MLKCAASQIECEYCDHRFSGSCMIFRKAAEYRGTIADLQARLARVQTQLKNARQIVTRLKTFGQKNGVA